MGQAKRRATRETFDTAINPSTDASERRNLESKTVFLIVSAISLGLSITSSREHEKNIYILSIDSKPHEPIGTIDNTVS